MKKLYFLLSLSLFIPQAHSMQWIRDVIRGPEDEVGHVAQKLVDNLRENGMLPQGVTVKETDLTSVVGRFLFYKYPESSKQGHYSSLLRKIYLCANASDVDRVRILAVLSLQAKTGNPVDENLLLKAAQSIRCDKCTEDIREGFQQAEDDTLALALPETGYTCPIHMREIQLHDESLKTSEESRKAYDVAVSHLATHPEVDSSVFLRDVYQKEENKSRASAAKIEHAFDAADWEVYQNPFDQ